jgi:protein TonB
MEKVWLGERRGEKWAGWFGSVALHAVLIGAALVPQSRDVPVRVTHHVVLPAYQPPDDSPTPVLRVFTQPGQGVGLLQLPEIPLPDLEVVPTTYASPTGLSLLQALALRREGLAAVPGTPAIETMLDDPPEVLSTPAVRYPALLRDAGIEGSVVLEFVVDTTGRVEPATIRIISSTQTLFEAPAREAIMQSRYRAGRWRGSPVRALALERVAFTIAR